MTDAFLLRLRAAIATLPPAQRVAPVAVDGRRYWVKRREHYDSLKLRLQKGDAARAFERERRALHDLGRLGLPVPPVVDEAEDYFVTPDSGVPLAKILRDRLLAEEERMAAFRAAARALHAFHAAGIAHGRPNLRDMLWDGERITLIDFERYAPRRNRRINMALDLLMFVFSAYVAAEGARPEIDAAIAAYREEDSIGLWPLAGRIARMLGFLTPLTAPLRRRRPRSRELAALPLTLHRFSAET